MLIAYYNLALVFNSTAAINHSLVLKAAQSCIFLFFIKPGFLAESVVLGMCVCMCVCIYVAMSVLPDNAVIYAAAWALQGFHCVCDLLIVIFCSYLDLCFLCLFFNTLY